MFKRSPIANKSPFSFFFFGVNKKCRWTALTDSKAVLWSSICIFAQENDLKLPFHIHKYYFSLYPRSKWVRNICFSEGSEFSRSMNFCCSAELRGLISSKRKNLEKAFWVKNDFKKICIQILHATKSFLGKVNWSLYKNSETTPKSFPFAHRFLRKTGRL